MLQKVEKIGENFRVKIPSTFAEECGIDVDSEIDIKVCNNRIVIETADHSFSSLMTYWSDVNDDECRSEMYFG